MGHRFTQIARRTAVVCLGTVLSLLVSRVENFGPQDMVQVEAGDIHRHDFVRRFGWPLTCVEHYYSNWYVWRLSGSVYATPEQQLFWTQRRIAALEGRPLYLQYEYDRGLHAALQRYRASVDGDFWRVNWRRLLLVIALWVVLVQLFEFSSGLLQRIWRTHRILSGHCPTCGYDLRATPERCPECGAVPAVK
jgi:hypothetical protein